ncbi:MAG: glycoside hydrolase family 15 protein [Acidobacteria bacterium]|nr:glycoside hydrolase family 15 protein [Acidobacteriota bacterium]
MTSLDLALIGNGTTSALIDADGDVVWSCAPGFDGDPVFCALLQNQPADAGAAGHFTIELSDWVRSEQEYVVNTPVLVTRLFDRDGASVEITDVMPRFLQHGRVFSPMMLVRQIRRTSGSPRIRIRLRPAEQYGSRAATATSGSNHIRYQCGGLTLRLTTNASITAVLDERVFYLNDAVTLMLGPDETVPANVGELARHFSEETVAYWREWVRYLSIPFEWQDAVIRSAITLKLNACEDTGAIVAAMTTSIPEAAGSPRNWDYRYCWLRDGYFVVDALNRLGATRTMERYLGYILNVVAAAEGRALQPVYGINGRASLDELEIDSLPGYRGMGPVRVGNLAYRQTQHDVYGSAILTATHVFFDRRLVHGGDATLFRRLELLGERAAAVFDQPDAGLWELRDRSEVHTFSSLMCWAGCDRLARIATRLGLDDRAVFWRGEAARIHQFICDHAWNASIGSFVSTMGGQSLDASMLRLNDVGFLRADDPRFISTVNVIGRDLMRGGFIFRYIEPDDFGAPENAFLACTFWYIDALATIGRRDEARALFENVLRCRNPHGLLAEHVDPRTGEQWGNFVQTYSMAGIIRCAIRLSVPWDEAF